MSLMSEGFEVFLLFGLLRGLQFFIVRVSARCQLINEVFAVFV